MMNDSTTKPLVSVIMPAYNAEKYIEAAIRSVQSQTVTQWELLVLDDGSTDGTCSVVQRLADADPRIRLLQNEQNLGAAKTRNRGFDLCAGDYVALLDSDDIWYPEKLSKQLERMEQTGADLSYCSYAIIDGEGNPARGDYVVPEQADFEGLLRENTIGCSTVVLRRRVVDQYRFHTDFFHEDYVLWLELLRSGFRAAGCAEVLAAWRYIETSRSFHKGKSARNRWRIYREYLKLPLWKSTVAFGSYIWASLKKYLR